MSADLEERIRERAYAIWQEAGCPQGCDQDHWLRAERELAATAKPAAKRRAGTAAKAPAGETGRKPRTRKVPVEA